MTEKNRLILERRHDRHENMIHAVFMIAVFGATISVYLLWRSL